MEEYSLADLGQVVKRLRREHGITQDQLGNAAGYQSGAGVSISRLENGRLEPTPERFAGIAQALGVNPEEIELQASEEAAAHATDEGNGVRTHEERIADIVRANEQRGRIGPVLDRFKEASETAEHAFLLKFRDVAALVVDALEPELSQVEQDFTADDDEMKAEAAYQIRFTQYGVSRALAQPRDGAVAGRVTPGLAEYRAFAEAVAFETVTLGAAIPRLAGASAALNGLRAAMGVGRSVSRVSTPGAVLLGGVTAGALVAAILDRQATAKRTRKKETTDQLVAAEADIAENQANVEVLLDVIPRASELLEYIAVHAGHALARWSTQIGEKAVPWGHLGEAQQQRYQDFVAIAAAQLALATIDLQQLSRSRGGDLEQAASLADEILNQSHQVITSRV